MKPPEQNSTNPLIYKSRLRKEEFNIIFDHVIMEDFDGIRNFSKELQAVASAFVSEAPQSEVELQAVICAILYFCTQFEKDPTISLLIQQIQLPLALTLVGFRNNYDMVYHSFVRNHQIFDLQLIINIYKFCHQNHKIILPYAKKSILELDEPMSLKEFLSVLDCPKVKDFSESKFMLILQSIRYFIQVIITRIDRLDINFETYTKWLNIIKFFVVLIKKDFDTYFDNIYNSLLYKLLKVSYKQGEYKVIAYIHDAYNFIIIVSDYLLK